VIRDEISETKDKTVLLKSGTTLSADYMVMCTGWGDHFGMFDVEQKAEIGLPSSLGGPSLGGGDSKDEIDWDSSDTMADAEVNKRLPFLANPPKLIYDKRLHATQQNKFRLFRRVVPVSFAEKGDRSLAIMGQIHTVQTPLVSEVQSLWAVLFLEGQVDLPDASTMAKEVSLWNAWTRKRYLNQGQKFPYSLYDFLPVSYKT
jgi:dimethylaniline monooxygenase (N-oxide forming)